MCINLLDILLVLRINSEGGAAKMNSATDTNGNDGLLRLRALEMYLAYLTALLDLLSIYYTLIYISKKKEKQ